MYRYCNICSRRFISAASSSDADQDLCQVCIKNVDRDPAGGGWRRKRHESLEEVNDDDVQLELDADGNFITPDV